MTSTLNDTVAGHSGLDFETTYRAQRTFGVEARRTFGVFRWTAASAIASLILCLCVNSASGQIATAPTSDQAAQQGVVLEKPNDGVFVAVEGKFMVPYTHEIPGTDVSFKMIPIPGGTFEMGREDAADTKPVVKVDVKPFWIGQYEVTWGEYSRYMALDAAFKKLHRSNIRKVTTNEDVDAVTAPSALYEPEITYEAGEEFDQPAASMTQFAAKQYTKWLSLLSGTLYRLPYEAEWEYACRAGTKTAFYFGDDESELENHAWFGDNSDYERYACGQLPPNPWGLFDMYGNVSEWVLDAYTADGYESSETAISVEASYRKPTTVFPRVLRGGSFVSDADLCNSTARLGSDDKPWKEEDPNYPKSPWWYTSEEGLGAGMRIVRPFDADVTPEEKVTFWEAGLDAIKRDALSRIDSNGRGAIGIVDDQLDEDLGNLKD